jgi:hypothetical protein
VSRRQPALAAVVLLALLAGGCGEQPEHQAPAGTANVVAEALSGIAQACGEHAQLRGLPSFGPTPARDAAVLAAARMRYVELEHAVSRNPAWLFQGRTLAEVHGEAARHLRECGLGRAVG